MESYGIVSRAQIDDEKLRPLVIKNGGHWPEGSEQGVIEKGDARIYILTDTLSWSYSDEELEVLETMIGGKPVSSVSVAYAWNEESEQLAKRFCKELIAVFGGYFEDNFTKLVPENPDIDEPK